MQRSFFVCAGLILAAFAPQAQAQSFLDSPRLIEAPRATISRVTPVYTVPGIWVQRDVDGVARWIRLGSTARVMAHVVPEHWVQQDRDHLVRVPAAYLPERIEESWLEIGPPVVPAAPMARSGPAAGLQPTWHSTINRAKAEEQEVRVTTIYVDADAENGRFVQPKQEQPPKTERSDDGWRPRTRQPMTEPAPTPAYEKRETPAAPNRQKSSDEDTYFDPAFLVRNR